MTQLRLAWGARVSEAFCQQVISMVQDFNWALDQASDVMSAIAFESGETFSPSVLNKAGSGAIGLIQFMPSTCLYIGVSTDQLAKMAAEEQLVWVAKYFKPYAKRIRTLEDLYMAILWPKAIGMPPTATLFTRGGATYRQNAALDANTDGFITKAEAAARVRAKRIIGLRDHNLRILEVA